MVKSYNWKGTMADDASSIDGNRKTLTQFENSLLQSDKDAFASIAWAMWEQRVEWRSYEKETL